jgi:hypothetical protein
MLPKFVNVFTYQSKTKGYWDLGFMLKMDGFVTHELISMQHANPNVPTSIKECHSSCHTILFYLNEKNENIHSHVHIIVSKNPKFGIKSHKFCSLLKEKQRTVSRIFRNSNNSSS